MIGVYGNNCAERTLLKKLFADIGADIRDFFAEIMLGELKIALLHGHDEELLQSIVRSEDYDLVVHGHTHRFSVRRKGRTIVLNPGEICGYLSGKNAIATYNLETREVKTITI